MLLKTTFKFSQTIQQQQQQQQLEELGLLPRTQSYAPQKSGGSFVLSRKASTTEDPSTLQMLLREAQQHLHGHTADPPRKSGSMGEAPAATSPGSSLRHSGAATAASSLSRKNSGADCRSGRGSGGASSGDREVTGPAASMRSEANLSSMRPPEFASEGGGSRFRRTSSLKPRSSRRSSGHDAAAGTEAELALGLGGPASPSGGLHNHQTATSPRQPMVRRNSANRRSSVVLLQHMMQLMTNSLPQE